MAEWAIEVRQPGRATLTLLVVAPLEVGRDCDGLLLADSRASRRHARLTPRDDGIEIADLDSRNGTWVDGTRIAQSRLLVDGAHAVVGDTQLLVGARNADRHTASATMTSILNPRSSIAMVLDAVEHESPVTGHVARPNATLTILFTDVESSTALASEMGDHAWLEVLREHNELVRHCLLTHDGTEVKTIGDGFMVTFRSALAGLECAVAIQRSLAARAGTDETWPIRVRIGLHTGEALRDRDDVFGTHVNTAARVAGAALGRQILVSGLLHDLVRPVTSIPMEPGYDIELKGLPGTHRVHRVAWQAPPAAPLGS